MSIVYNVSGKISEDMNEAVKFLSEKLNCEKPGGPQAFFTLCKRMDLCYEMDHPNDTFTVYYSLPEEEEDYNEVSNLEGTETEQEEVQETTEEQSDSNEDVEKDVFDDLF